MMRFSSLQTAFSSPILTPLQSGSSNRTSSACSRQPPTAVFGLFRPRNQSTPIADPEPVRTGTQENRDFEPDPAPVQGPPAAKVLDDSANTTQDNRVPMAFSTPKVPYPPPDPNTVLVIGASGRLGSDIVRELLKAPGCIIVACVRSTEKAREIGLYALAEEVAERREEGDMGLRPSRLDIVQADVITQTEEIVQVVKQKGVGAVVFAASGGPRAPAQVDNVAVGELVRALEGVLGGAANARELRIFDFERDGVQGLEAFRSVDDRVMGGLSSSRIVMMDGGKSARFTGEVTTARNGGFAQVRGNFGMGDGEYRRLDLSQYAGVAIRCRGDGRRYKLNLKDEERPEFVYQVSFGTVEGEWQTLRFPFSGFLPVRRGRIAYRDGPGKGIYASTLDTSRIVSLGLVVSKIEPGGEATPGFSSGSFELEISHVSSYRSSTPRFVLVSAAAVTRPFWSEEQRRLNASAADIAIVRLNPSNILGHKLAGENFVRKSSIPWAIVRPFGMPESVSGGRKLVVRQGDTITGFASREDVAKGIVSALRAPAATWKTFELGAMDAREGEEKDLKPDDFAILEMDKMEAPYAEDVDGLVET